jgi:hypothetical protein
MAHCFDNDWSGPFEEEPGWHDDASAFESQHEESLHASSAFELNVPVGKTNALGELLGGAGDDDPRRQHYYEQIVCPDLSAFDDVHSAPAVPKPVARTKVAR